MKPIAIFRFSASEGPGYFADFLAKRAVPWTLIAVDAGDPIPSAVAPFSGLCLMGGPMSVNDPLPWIPKLIALLNKAIAAHVPIIGHCLGGQLLARALGAPVGPNPVKEIGWGEVTVDPVAAAHDWFGPFARFAAFHWHGETFAIPEGATHLAASRWCMNQAFAYGPHLGLQCHVEMTEPLIRLWCAAWAEEGVTVSDSVQSPEAMLAEMAERLPLLHQVADHLYTRWLRAVPGATP